MSPYCRSSIENEWRASDVASVCRALNGGWGAFVFQLSYNFTTMDRSDSRVTADKSLKPVSSYPRLDSSTFCSTKQPQSRVRRNLHESLMMLALSRTDMRFQKRRTKRDVEQNSAALRTIREECPCFIFKTQVK